MRGIGWEEGEGRNNGGGGKFCARIRFKKGGGRQESVKGGGERSGEGEQAFPAVHPFGRHSMSIFQRYILFVTKYFYRRQANLSTCKFIFWFQLCIYIQHKHSVTYEGIGNRKGLLSLPPPTPPPLPRFIHTACSILKLHPCASHKINRQNCFRWNIFKL